MSFVPDMPQTQAKWFRMGDLKHRPDGSCTVRFITDVVTGLEKWTEANKPVRVSLGEAFPSGVKWRKGEDGVEEPPKVFMAAGVHNVTDDIEQVWTWTQKKFHTRLKAKMARFKGDPKDAAITVTRLDTKPVDYDVDVEKAEPYTPEQAKRIEFLLGEWTGPVALIGNGDPWKPFGEDDVPAF